MTLVPSRRSAAVAESVTLAIASRAKQLQASGRPVLSLGAGEPDFGTPDPIKDAGVRAIRDGETRYTAAAGMPELRAAGADAALVGTALMRSSDPAATLSAWKEALGA